MTSLAVRRAAIEDEIQYLDIREHTHHIISLELTMIANEFGDIEANRAIRDLGLDKLGWSENK